MKKRLILPDGKYLGQILAFLPANRIIYKYLTGCGATHLEIFCNRWSIIVEPYIPVILGKQWMKVIDKKTGLEKIVKNPEVLAVYEKTSKDDIIEFLSQSQQKYKLVTTPEGMVKIINACAELEIDPFKKFFLLVDECEKLIQDANFRDDITVVMDYFFQFKKRSFVSATPIAPSDARFKEHKFTDYFIIPKNIKKINIKLHATNNLASTIKSYFNTHKNSHYLIFINSTERIASIIKFLKIQKEAQVFCAKESSDILKINGICNTSIYWSKDKFKKYNFFTSRFFTAFDLEVDCKPNVLIISDFKKVKHSALDPETDIIQIAGRARNGINHLCHITNWEVLQTQTPEEIKGYINGLGEGYRMIEQLRDQCSNYNSIGTYDVLNQALKACKYNNYLNKRTRVQCPYLIDNEVHSNRVIAVYASGDHILDAYSKTNRFQVDYHISNFNLSDSTLESLKKGVSRRETLKAVCEIFAKYFEQAKEEFNISPNYALTELIKTHQTLYQYYRVIGIDRIREMNYNVKKIEKEYNLKEIENSDSFYRLTYTFLLIFKKDKCYTGAKIVRIMKYYFNKYNIRLQTTVAQLRKWFDIPERRFTLGYMDDGREIKGYKIGEPKNWIVLPQKFRQ
jgi:hypothetical protein